MKIETFTNVSSRDSQLRTKIQRYIEFNRTLQNKILRQAQSKGKNHSYKNHTLYNKS